MARPNSLSSPSFSSSIVNSGTDSSLSNSPSTLVMCVPTSDLSLFNATSALPFTMMRPAAGFCSKIQRLRPMSGCETARNSVPNAAPSTTTDVSSSIRFECITTVWHPDAVASLAAAIFVAMPPVPKFDPAPALVSTSRSSMFSTSGMMVAFGSLLGLPVYSPSTSVNKKR